MTHVSFVNMHILGWGNSFLTSTQASLFPLFFFFFPPCLSSSSYWCLPPPPGPKAGGSSCDFILKVGGRSMWKEPKMTWLTSEAKLMIVLYTLFWSFADLHSFSQIWSLKSTARRTMAGNSLSRHSFALKIYLWWIIMFKRAQRLRDLVLNLPRMMSFAILNIRSCPCISWKFVGARTSCLFNALSILPSRHALGLGQAGG